MVICCPLSALVCLCTMSCVWELWILYARVLHITTHLLVLLRDTVLANSFSRSLYVCLSVCLSVCSLSVCNVREPYSGDWNFRHISTPFGTLAISDLSVKNFYRDRPRETPTSEGGVKRKSGKVYCILQFVYGVVVKKVYVRYLIFWWVSCIYSHFSSLVRLCTAIIRVLCKTCSDRGSVRGTVELCARKRVTFRLGTNNVSHQFLGRSYQQEAQLSQRDRAAPCLNFG